MRHAGMSELETGGTVLLVEDETFVREVACEVLRSDGYRVLTAKNAHEATEIYEDEKGEIELLLTDMILPGETGQELAERLRKRDPKLKVLLASGYGEQITGLGQGSEEYLAKPFCRDELLEKVREKIGTPVLAAMESSGPAATSRLQELAWNLS